MDGHGLLEGFLSRNRPVLVVCLAAATALAWLYILLGAGMSMPGMLIGAVLSIAGVAMLAGVIG